MNGLGVGVFRPRVARFPLGSDGQSGLSKDELFSVVVGLQSQDHGKKFDYVTWRGSPHSARLVDDLGNKYPLVKLPTVYPAGSVVRETVYSDKQVLDVLIFERPVPAAKYLDLDLPAPFDPMQTFQFRIKAAEITRQ